MEEELPAHSFEYIVEEVAKQDGSPVTHLNPDVLETQLNNWGRRGFRLAHLDLRGYAIYEREHHYSGFVPLTRVEYE